MMNTGFLKESTVAVRVGVESSAWTIMSELLVLLGRWTTIVYLIDIVRTTGWPPRNILSVVAFQHLALH